jgi:hypothetical protein
MTLGAPHRQFWEFPHFPQFPQTVLRSATARFPPPEAAEMFYALARHRAPDSERNASMPEIE